jgi:hypothetical protein
MSAAASTSPRDRKPVSVRADPNETDISHRGLLDRLVAELKAMKTEFTLRFTHLDDSHARLERRLDIIDDKLDHTRETVADLVGERRGELQAGDRGLSTPPSQSVVKKLSLVGAVGIGVVTVLGGLSSAYETAGRLLSAVIRAISTP